MIRGRTRGSAGSTTCPGRLTLRLLHEVPRGRPAVTGDLGPGPRARGVDQLSQGTQNSERGPAVATSFPGRLGPGSEVPQDPTYVPGDSGPGPRARGIDQLSQENRTCAGSPTV